MPDKTLGRRRILVVEDEYFLAQDLCRDLIGAGATIAGPVPSVADAMAVLEGEPIDGAVLDVNLGGEMVYPVADALVDRDVPFVFLTGYDRTSLPARYRERVSCEKPVEARLVVDAMGKAVSGLIGSD